MEKRWLNALSYVDSKGEFTGFQKIQFHEKLKENGKEVIRYNCCKEQLPAETGQVYHQHRSLYIPKSTTNVKAGISGNQEIVEGVCICI